MPSAVPEFALWWCFAKPVFSCHKQPWAFGRGLGLILDGPRTPIRHWLERGHSALVVGIRSRLALVGRAVCWSALEIPLKPELPPHGISASAANNNWILFVSEEVDGPMMDGALLFLWDGSRRLRTTVEPRRPMQPELAESVPMGGFDVQSSSYTSGCESASFGSFNSNPSSPGSTGTRSTFRRLPSPWSTTPQSP
ncbi:uncharacterized protein B0I36DRAFT_405952 [Microdochium trichocladiopsis]|uniref:Uncharacterized protein n=1 Tax=Microdochium trichocladiopsis TaxID=1682393 RepID=A0A9P8YED6_9PEZI|nr:uncharacterized protein B0I36DRAFT_405952 [Microdochium trichocladiopsis]KAH7035411.1 hypothetical protein B0I36DRAFT_405952 [Microdochium trichocladiopsis]